MKQTKKCMFISCFSMTRLFATRPIHKKKKIAPSECTSTQYEENK